MTEITVGIFGLLGMFALMILRMPVGMAMLVTGFFGIWVLNSEKAASATLVTEAFLAISNYNLTVVPLFILMGNVASAAGFSRALYDAAYAWVGRLPGGLAISSVLGCAAFSAVSGSSVATAVTIGKVALPEMKRLGYGDGLATGSVAAGGTLGFLIPPSTGFVLYAILTEESIGRLFMAGILPGLLLTILFIAAIWITTLRDPSAGPCGDAVPTDERIKRLIAALPLITVILVSIGGIYLGVFTPVEAAGIGAILIILMALISRKMALSAFQTACQDTVKTTAMLYMIVIGANVLNPFLALTGITQQLGGGLESVGAGPFATLMLIILIYIVLGMFMDGLSMLVITIPIFYPIIIGHGFDPIWFGVIAVIVIEMGMITPPVGLNVFVVKGVAENVPLTTIFRGVLPFWLAMAAALALIVLVPDIALMIPNSMFD